MKMIRKALAVILACLMVAGCVPVAFAAEKSFDGKFTYSLDGSEITLLKYIGTDTDVVIPSEIDGFPVRHIGEEFMSQNNNVKSVSVPDTVYTIENNAFRECAQIEALTLGKKLKSIGQEAFAKCESLESFTFPDSVEHIGNGVFTSCTSLKNVSFPDGITSIPQNIFHNCTSIDKLDLPETVTQIESGAYFGTSLESVYIPRRITHFGTGVFSECKQLKTVVFDCVADTINTGMFEACSSLESVTLNDDITVIKPEAFSGCSSLRSIDLPARITSMGGGCFEGCSSLTSLKIPGGVTTISSEMLMDCYALESVELPDDVTKIEENAFAGCSSLKDVKLPSKLKNINKKAFLNCSSLESVELPSGVTYVSESLFEGCSSLESAVLPDTLTTVGISAFRGCSSLKSIEIPDTVTVISEKAFSKCSSLKTAAFGKKVLSIGKLAFFGCEALESITLPENVSYIYDYAFLSCPSAKKIIVRNSKAYIQYRAFGYTGEEDGYTKKNENPPAIYGYDDSTAYKYAKDCDFQFVSLNTNPPGVQTVITLDKDTIELEETRAQKIGLTIINPAGTTHYESAEPSIATVNYKGMVRGVSEGETYIVIVNSNATVLQRVVVKHSDIDYTKEQQNSEFRYAFDEDENGGITVRILGYVGDGGKVVIPSKLDGFSVTTVGAKAFENRPEITEIEISEGIETINECAFAGCENLRSIKFPDSLAHYGNELFADDTRVERIEFPSVKRIINLNRYGNYLIPYSHPYRLYINGSEASRLVIPDGTAEIPSKMFANCTSIKSLILPESVDMINYQAFKDCSSLEYVKLPNNNISGISGSSFEGCEKLDKIDFSNYVGYIGPDAFKGTALTEIKLSCKVRLIYRSFSGCPKLKTVSLGIRELSDYHQDMFADSPSLEEIYFDVDAPEVNPNIFDNMTASPVIYGEEYTSLQKAAKAHGLRFVPIESLPTEPSSTAAPTTAEPTEPTEPTLPAIPVYPDFFYDPDTLTYKVTDSYGAQKGESEVNYPSDASHFAKTVIFDFEKPVRLTSRCTQWFDSVEKVIIQGNVKGIDGSAFTYNKETLKEVSISPNVEWISDSAFMDCDLLTEIPNGEGLRLIGDYAFAGCSGLKDIHIPDTVKRIGQNAFGVCDNLEKVQIPTSVTKIDKAAFCGCENLKEVLIPQTATQIDDFAFGYLYNSYQKEYYPIPGFKIKAVKGSAGEKYAIDNDFEVEYVDELPTTPEAQTDPTETVTQSPTASTAEPTQPQTETEERLPEGLQVELKDDNTYKVTGYNGSATQLVIPAAYQGKTINEIGEKAFLNNRIIKKVFIPDTVTEIGTRAFTNCKELRKVGLPAKLQKISVDLFRGSKKLIEVTIPDKVTLIGEYSFAGTAIEEIVIPDSVTEIGSRAFEDCWYLNSITIGEGLKKIGENAFSSYVSNENIYIKNLEQWCGIEFESIDSCPIRKTTSFYVNGELLTDLVVPKGCRYIGSYAFCWYNKLKSVTAENVETVNINAFHYCKNLETVCFSNKLLEIKDMAFWGCKSLRSLRLGNGIKTIGIKAFCDCDSLTAFFVPKSVEFIGWHAVGMNDSEHIIDNFEMYGFKGSVAENYAETKNMKFFDVERVPVPEGAVPVSPYDGPDPTIPIVTEPETEPFTGETEEKNAPEKVFSYYFDNNNDLIIRKYTGDANIIRIPDKIKGISVKRIDSYAFKKPCITELIFPDTFTKIGDYVVMQSDNLKRVTIPDSVTEIGEGAFEHCKSLEKINIPESVKTIGENAFLGCTALKEINLPEGLTTIGRDAFTSCKSVETIKLPASLESIGSFNFIGDTSLKSIEVAEGNSAYCAVDGVLFNKDKTKLLIYPPAKQDAVYTVAQSVTELAYAAFEDCDNLVELKLPETITELGSIGACKNLKKINIPHNITALPSRFLSGCSSLQSVEIPDGVTVIPARAFEGCRKLLKITLPDSVTLIERCAFNNCVSLYEVNLGVGLKTIESDAFQNCASLTRLYVPESVEKIGDFAIGTVLADASRNYYTINHDFTIEGKRGTAAEKYANSYHLNFFADLPEDDFEYKVCEDGTARITAFTGKTSVAEIPESIDGHTVTSVAPYALKNSRITEIIFPATMTVIGESAAEGCKNLEKITLPEGVTEIGKRAFGFCEKLKDVKLPDSIKTIGDEAFFECREIKEITLPEGLEVIGNAAFSFGESIDTIRIPASVISLGSNFCGGKALKSYEVHPDNKYYRSEDGVLFNKDKTELIDYPYAKEGSSYTVPDTVTRFEDGAFSSAKLEELYFPDTIESFGMVGSAHSLKKLKFPSGITEIPWSCFYGCSSLESVEIPSGVETIGSMAFGMCESLRKIILPDSVRVIEDHAFLKCTKLDDVKLGSGLQTIKEDAFVNCLSLTRIYIPESVQTIEPFAIGLYLKDPEQNFYTLNHDVIIEGKRGTAAEQYANAYNLNFFADLPETEAPTASEPESTVTEPTTAPPVTDPTEPATTEPTTATEPAPTEPTTATEPATTEPTTATEPATTEPTTATEPATTEPTTATTEPTTTTEPATTEPTIATEPVTTEPTTATEPATTEPTTATEPATTEPTTVTEPATTEPTTVTEPVTAAPKKAQTAKKKNPVKITVKRKTVSSKKLSAKSLMLAPLIITNAKGKLSFVLIKNGTSKKLWKRLKINKNGSLTLKKGGYKRASYKVKVKITAKGNSRFKKRTLTKVIRLRIK